MNDIITTAEELDVLPPGSVVLDPQTGAIYQNGEGGLWWMPALRSGIGTDELIEDGEPLTVLYRPDQPTEPARVLPSRDEIARAIVDTYEGAALWDQWVRFTEQNTIDGCDRDAKDIFDIVSDARKSSDAVLALFANTPTVEQVKAEALREHRRRVVRFMPTGLVNRATVLADLDDYADRLAPTQPAPDVPEAGLPTAEVPNVGGEQHG